MSYRTTKEKIIDCSIDLFTVKGYTETSVREIARQVGINQGAIYNYFASKSEILDYILKLYIDYTNKSTPSLKEIDLLVRVQDARTTIKSMFYEYADQDVLKYSKIIKIILHEQYRNEQVGNFVKNHVFINTEDYIFQVLTKLKETKKISPVDCRMYAKLINSLLVATIVEYSHYLVNENYVNKLSTSEILDYLIDTVFLKDIPTD